MIFSIYDLMQRAVDIVSASEHPSNKIAATLAGQGLDGKPYAVSFTNFWPEAIKAHFGTHARIGSSSGTIHAETACILNAPITRDASLFVTDLPCPNCVKNIVEAGIKTLYIDHKGFDKDFAQRRGHHFDHMSLRICEQAGISIYKLWRKEERLEPILEIPKNYTPPIENPALAEPVEDKMTPALFADYIKIRRKHYGEDPFAACVATLGKRNFLLSAQPHPVMGYTAETMEDPEGKYNLLLEPVNRLLTNAARKGLKIDPAYLYSSRVPTSRELVNMIGAGLTSLAISDRQKARDNDALGALKQLENAGILQISS